MEDEECLPENSSLKLYLQNLGFTDFPVSKIPPRNPLSFRFEVPKPKLNFQETIDEDVVGQISTIISTQLLFEEDISKVEKLLSSFKIVKTGMLKSMFKNVFGVAIIFLGLCLFWVIGYYSFFIVSSFYAFTAADYLSRKHFSQSRLKKLTSVLQSNFTLLRRTIKFIEENRLLEVNFCKSNPVEYTEGFDFYNTFKSDFLICLNEMIDILGKSTQKLIIKIPLCDYIENPEFYLCNNLEKNDESISVSNLYKIYLLMQSEFLQRLILSLIPNINLTSKDGFSVLNEIITETCIGLLKLKNKLNKKFKFLFLNGIYSPKSDIQFKLPPTHNSRNRYSSEFLLNIHETSNTFQKLLLQCRIVEEKVMSDKISEFVEEELIKIQQNLNACHRNITDSLILYKKANSTEESSQVTGEVKIQAEKELESSNQGLNKVVLGYSDLDPKIEDEIFEACFSKNSASNLSGIDTWELEEQSIRKEKKELCKNVMNELKVKIQEKAEYWKKKEKELLKKKYNNDVNECEEDEEKEIKDIKDSTNNVHMPETLHCQEIARNYELDNTCESKNYGDDNSTETSEVSGICQAQHKNFQGNCTDENIFESGKINEKNLNNLLQESFKCEPFSESLTQNFNKNFLNDLNQARFKIFNSTTTTEESFYASGEDSSSESNHSL